MFDFKSIQTIFTGVHQFSPELQGGRRRGGDGGEGVEREEENPLGKDTKS